MFLRNCWYVAAWDSEVGEAPLARTLLGEPVVLFRTADGVPVALEDRCCHRNLPLSLGRVIGPNIRCGYHGLEFDRTGRCVKIPGQSAIPPGAEVRAYPVVERWHWIWIWMGDAAAADPALIPDWWWMDHPEWRMIPGNGGKSLYTRADYRLIVDNLLDLSHLVYIHTDTLGNDEITRFPVRTERLADGVRMIRMMPEVEPPPFHRMAGDFKGKVDRWQIVDVTLPGHSDVDVGCAVPGRGALEGERNQGTAFHALIAPTPETERTSHQFYAHPRHFQVANEKMDEIYRHEMTRVFLEDLEVMEAQQEAMDRDPEAPLVDINVDAPSIAVRRLLAERIAAEEEARRAA